MVGGKVIGVARGPENTLVHVRDPKGGRGDECSVRVVERRERDGSPVTIGIGDSIWWQGGSVMWTPKERALGIDTGVGCGREYDIRLPKIGFSH